TPLPGGLAMSTFPIAGSPQPFDPTRRRSRMIFHWRAAELTIEAITGQTPTFERSSTATATDSRGATTTYPYHHPAYQVTNGRVGVLYTAGDWRYAFAARPQALTV